MKHALTLTLCLAAAGANAQSVYRCGSAYSQEPCPQARLVDVSDPRSASQRADALLLAANDEQLGNEMTRERPASEAAQKRAATPGHAKPAKKARATKIKWFRP
ncbi:MAG: hypothetical protein ABI887_20230 [Burkholderiales bacterium]